jgi:hypothetical protein
VVYDDDKDDYHKVSKEEEDEDEDEEEEVKSVSADGITFRSI